MVELLGNVIGFGPFKLSRSDYCLMRETGDGGWLEVPLRPKAFDLLRYMVENPGRLISPDELLDRLWPNVHVQADGLKGHVLNVRTALGDDPNNPTYVETVRGRGYRFVAPVSALGNGSLPMTARDVEITRLVGRSVARRELETLLRRAASAAAEIGFVTGEPGIGKTALVNEFIETMNAAGIPALVGRCLPGSADRDPYYPVLDVLNQLVRTGLFADFLPTLAGIAPTWLIQLPWLMSSTIAGGTRQEVFGATPYRMIRELCDLLDHLGRDQLLVVIFEDIHWADQATLDLINAIATRRLQTRLFLLSTMRVSANTPSAKAARVLCQTLSLYRLSKEISLAPLTESEVCDYLAGIAGTSPPAQFSLQLHARSEGNPLFMTAMLDHFIQEGFVTLGRAGWVVAETMDEAALRAPPSLAQLIESEVEKLDADAQAVLDSASVSEGIFCAAVNQAATALDEARFEAVCEELARTTALIQRADDVVLPSLRRAQGYSFRHMIFRDVVYERQSIARRAAAHLAVGNRVETLFGHDPSPVASVLARHFLAAEQWCKAIGYLQLVARNAILRFSAREAAATLEQALNYTLMHPPADQTGAELVLLEDLARLYTGSLDARAGETYARLAQVAANAGRLDVECRALLGLGFAVAWVDLDRSVAVWGQAIEKSAALEDPIARARTRTYAHGWRSWLAVWSEPDAAACAAALEEIRASGDQVALNASLVDYCLILFPSSRYREAHDTIQSCFDVLVADGLEKRADISLPLWIVRLGRPWTLMCDGDLAAALPLFKSGVRSFLDNGDMGRAATLQFYEGFCHVHMQDHQGALDLCGQALGFCDSGGSVRLSPNEQQIERVVRGLANLGIGRIEEAMGLFAAASDGMRQWRTLTTWHWRMALEWGTADACLALDQIAEAERHALLFQDYAYAIRERTWRALASECCARIALRRGDLAAAAEHLRHGWAEMERGDLKLVAWRLHAVEAELHNRAGNEAAADQHRRAWSAALQALAATLPTDHVGHHTLTGARPIFGVIS